ncbi:MAG TPA: YqzL family protein [Virgibacillus sp.]|nr:YqzL family protein [Virgibacillus sp.]
MLDLTWKLFSQTGNIETYLLLKELESESNINDMGQTGDEKVSSLDTNL